MAAKSNTTGTVVQNTVPAAQRALSIPEIVAEICGWLSVCFKINDRRVTKYPGKAQLARCVRVNNTWFGQAIHYVWQDITEGSHVTLPTLFKNINSDRRQMYASLVMKGQIRLIYSNQAARKADRVLNGLTFHNLRALHIPLWDNVHIVNLYLPTLDAPKVRSVELDATY